MRAKRIRQLAMTALVGCAALTAAPAHGATGKVEIDVLSSRADLLSGGDAVIAISVPKDRKVSDLTVKLGARTVTSQFATRANGRFAALLTGIANGKSTLTAALPDGSGASIALTGHPHGGPVIAGPQLKPWICQAGARDAQCNQPPAYQLYAKTSDGLEAYDPASPPSGIENTTTDEGVTVPFIVRVETGYQDRDQYKVATLHDPAKPWSPFAPQKGWNRKVVITHGGSCGTDRKVGEAPDVLNEEVLGKGFMVLSTALNNLGHNCNPVLITESEIMLKERVNEQYGPIRYTIGSGCSGGSIAQMQAAHAYPGVYQGITVQCTFVDLLTTGKHAAAGHLFQQYLRRNPSFGPEYSFYGGSPLATTDDAVFESAFWANITGEAGCKGMDPALKWSPSNTGGVRCGALDHNINIFGKGPSGYAGVPLDSVGVQFGLKPLLAGQITPASFAKVNSEIGGIDKTTYADQAARTVADPEQVTNAYRSGYMALGNTLDRTPIIEGRGPNESIAHVTYPTLSIRARLDKQFGNHDNHVLWQGPTPLVGDASFANRMIFAMDKWVAAIQKDDSSTSQGAKVRANKPKDLVDFCEAGGVKQPGSDCPAINRFYESPSNVAGESIRGDILKCQLKPLSRSDYKNVTFTDAQFETLQKTFPSGVCDFTKPGVGATDTVPWLTYKSKAGGEELGAAPRSVAVFGRRAVVYLRRARAALMGLRRARTTRVTLLKAKRSTTARGVRIEVRDARGRLVAKSATMTITKDQTTVTLARVRAFPRGIVRVRVFGSDARGRLPTRLLRLRY